MGSHINRTDDTRRVLDGIRRIVQALRASSRDAERSVGLSAAQLFVLTRLADGPALSLNELAARTFTHQSSASVVVTRLVERGFVRRQRGGDDGRRVELALTPMGRALIAKAPHAAQERLIAGLSRMRVADVRQLGELLDALIVAGRMADTPAALFFEDEKERSGHAPRRHRTRLDD